MVSSAPGQPQGNAPRGLAGFQILRLGEIEEGFISEASLTQ
jgi:hypothetical protein